MASKPFYNEGRKKPGLGSPFPFTIALVAAGAVNFVFALYAWRARAVPAARYLAGISLAASIYSVGCAFELASPTLPAMLIWTRVEYLGISFLPPLWVIFIGYYTGKKKYLTRPVRTALFSLSALTLVLHWTQAWHDFFYVRPRIDASGPFPVLAFDGGPWYWGHQVYINASLLVSFFVLIHSALGSSRVQRRQAGVMILGSACPWLAYILYIFRLGPLRIDLVPFGLALASPIFAWGVFRLKILEFVPIAKDGIIDGMRDGVIVIDLAGRVTDLNPAATRIFPHLSRESCGMTLASLVQEHPDLVRLLTTGTPPEVEIRVPSGEADHLYKVYLSPVLSRRRPVGYAVLLSDTTAQNLLRERLQIQATVDDLTGAANRRHFLETGRRELARAKRYGRALSVAIFDLDTFKKINDTFGHEAGDQVLAATCETVRKGLRASDLLGRHGGEEFILLLPETPPAQAAAVAERLRQALIQTHVKLSSGSSLGFTASFGVAGTESVGNELLDDFIRAADKAMYEAKAAGRNCVRSKDLGTPA